MNSRELKNAVVLMFKYYPSQYSEEELDRASNRNRREIKRNFDEVLDAMPKEERRILKMENIRHAQPDWWQEYYSKSTYYRLRRKAHERFLEWIKR